MTNTELVATAWTSAGNTSPMRVPPTSPIPIAERVAAVADAGYLGRGLITDDLAAIRASITSRRPRPVASRGGRNTSLDLRWF